MAANSTAQSEAERIERIKMFYDCLLSDLETRGSEFTEDFFKCLTEKSKTYRFSSGRELETALLLDAEDETEDGCDLLIHRIIQCVQAGSPKVKPEDAATVVQWLVGADKTMISERNTSGFNALEMAVRGDRCLDIIKVICEHGMTKQIQLGNNPPPGRATMDRIQSKKKGNLDPKDAVKGPGGEREVNLGLGKGLKVLVEWQELLPEHGAGNDSFLHTAIRQNRVEYVEYLLRRIQLTSDLELLLGHFGRGGLTPLHIAVDARECGEERIQMAALIIKMHPDALKYESGVMSSKTQHGNGKDPQPQANEKAVKGNLKPYKYLLESAGGSIGRSNRRHAKEPSEIKKQAAERMKTLLRLSCMRHHGVERSTITTLLDATGQIHLDLSSRTRVTQGFLDYMNGINFEPYLQYVHIPKLEVVNVQNGELERSQWWDCKSRKDYLYIFQWLKQVKNVQQILSIVVVDDEANPHSDEAIEHAIKPFDIEKWNWMKLDICSDTILAAAKNVRELDLHWSGSRAVLKGWAAKDGLVELEKLEKIRIMTPESRESKSRTEGTMEKFEKCLAEEWNKKWNADPDQEVLKKVPHIDIITQSGQMHTAAKLSRTEREERRQKEQWLRCMEEFTETLRRYMNGLKDKPEDILVKVAIIDDGVNAESDGIGQNIVLGETFYDDGGQWPGYYQSTHGHGHLMACLIREMCPKVRLYVAKLNETWSNGKHQITAESAAKAIEWATTKKVDIISMSWTIEEPSAPAKYDLTTAINGALAQDILLFCASNDQGNLTDIPYPAQINKDKIFRIGSATRLGQMGEGTERNVMFIAPGQYHVEETGGSALGGNAGAAAVNGTGKGSLGVAETLSGSSIATARCAGLAALILQCVMLRQQRWPKSEIRKFSNMQKMLGRLVKQDDRYLRVWDVFEAAKKRSEMGSDEEKEIVFKAADAFLGADMLG